MSDRNCEQPGCEVSAGIGDMVLLFRECWYCPDHAKVQLEAAQAERALTEDEKETLVELGGSA